jgi:GT2 family glycosyltransferase
LIPGVSVVVTVRNEAERLPFLLAALEAQTLDRSQFEVIVVDDGSTDETATIARQSATRVIEAGAHVGLPRGRNIGVRAARATIIAFTDGDCVPAPDWLETGLAQIENLDADILAGAITVPVDREPTVASLVDVATFFDQEAFAARGFGAGANLWIRRKVFETHGMFDERLGMYGDEEELCQRATRDGARLVFAPEVHVAHSARRRVRDIARKGFLLGFCLAAHRDHTTGPLASHPKIFLQPRAYLPGRRIYGLERVTTQYRPSRWELMRMYALQYIVNGGSRLVGDATGELVQLAKRRGVRRRAQPLAAQNSRTIGSEGTEASQEEESATPFPLGESRRGKTSPSRTAPARTMSRGRR